MLCINKVNKSILRYYLVLFAVLISACSKTDFPELKDNGVGFDPATEKEEVNRILQVKGNYTENTPFPSKSGPLTLIYQGFPFTYDVSRLFLINLSKIDTIEIGNESNAFIPLRFTFVDKGEYFTPKFAYLRVSGAKGLWKIPIEPDPSQQTANVSSDGFCSLAVPALVREGDIAISISAALQCNFLGYENNIVYTDTVRAILSVRKPIPCGRDTVKGRAGLTIRKIDFGKNAQAGTINIKFKSFGIPDRMEVRMNGKYMVSTCDEMPEDATFPSCKPDWCFKTTGVSGEGWFDYSFPYNPANDGRYAEVLIRGSCDDPRTFWSFFVDCPQ